MPTNRLYVVNITLAQTRTAQELASEAADHLYGADGEQFVYVATSEDNVASFALVCAMQPHEAEDWASELTQSTATQLVAIESIPTHA